MEKTKIGLSKEFPFCIRDSNVHCSTLCKYNIWSRSPKDEEVKAFSKEKYAKEYAKNKHLLFINTVIPYKEWD